MYSTSVAVVGAGFIGPVHVEALRRLGVRITGILAANDELSERSQKALGLPKWYRSFSEVLDDNDVQAVHLAVPNVFHYEMAKQALLAGKHVLCEKPLSMNSAQSAELVELAASRKQAAAVCYNIRFYPLNLEARDMASRGDLGNVYAINGSYTQDWLFHETDYNWRVLAEEGGELRAIADIGTHWMDLVLSVTGLEVQAVCADLNTVHKTRLRPKGEVETFTGKLKSQNQTEPIDINTEDYGCVMFRFSNGAKGSLWVSQVTAGRKNCLRYEIAGSNKALAWNSEAPNEIWIGHRDKANEVLMRDPALVSSLARNHITFPGGHNEGFPDTFKQCFKAFYDYIEAGDFYAKPLFPTFAEGHREVAVCEAILKSHREQRWVSL